MKHTGFLKLFWGLLIVYLDLRINHFDILVDFIGYLIALMGIFQLQDDNEWFGKAKVPIMIQLIISIFTPFLEISDGVSSASQGSFLSFIFTTLTIALNLYFVYCVVEGMKELTYDHDNIEFADKITKFWSYYLWVNIITVIVIPLNFLLLSPVMILTFILIVANLIVEFIFLYFLYQSADEFSY